MGPTDSRDSKRDPKLQFSHALCWVARLAGLVVHVDEGITQVADSLARVSFSTEAGHHEDAVLACRGMDPSFLGKEVAGSQGKFHKLHP